jgi:hypothetical protein
MEVCGYLAEYGRGRIAQIDAVSSGIIVLSGISDSLRKSDKSRGTSCMGIVQAVIFVSFSGLCSSRCSSVQPGRVWSPVISLAPRSKVRYDHAH